MRFDARVESFSFHPLALTARDYCQRHLCRVVTLGCQDKHTRSKAERFAYRVRLTTCIYEQVCRELPKHHSRSSPQSRRHVVSPTPTRPSRNTLLECSKDQFHTSCPRKTDPRTKPCRAAAAGSGCSAWLCRFAQHGHLTLRLPE